uniref:Uncharacterized protein n=1 Tax=Oryza punctata TaxID=4537 RepID=A0A0E0JJV9_ORYPU
MRLLRKLQRATTMAVAAAIGDELAVAIAAMVTSASWGSGYDDNKRWRYSQVGARRRLIQHL